MKPKRCIINFAKGGWYPQGQQRLLDSLKLVGWTDPVLSFSDEAEIGAPSHQSSPYAFKPFALQYAFSMGFEQVVWADSSVWAIKPIEPMFEHLTKHGHMFFHNANAGAFSSDASLKSFGIDREDSFNINMLMGICMGWDMRHPKCIEFMRRWQEKSTDGVTFPGAWTNHNQEVSSDPRVKGHRHDQTAASFIAHQMCMELIIAHETYFQYYENPTRNLFVLNPTLEMIRPGVVMVAQGM